MLFGCLQTKETPDLDAAIEATGPACGDEVRLANGPFGMVVRPSGVRTLDSVGRVYQSGDVLVALLGQIFNLDEIEKLIPSRESGAEAKKTAAILAKAYRHCGADIFAKLNGSFAAVILDRNKGHVILARDHLGIEPLFYAETGDGIWFSTSLRLLINLPQVGSDLSFEALHRYLLFNYNPTYQTFFKRARKVPPGHLLLIDFGGGISLRRYWRLNFQPVDLRPEEEIREELLERLRRAVSRRVHVHEGPAGAFLSGGMDSSSVVGLMAPLLDNPVHTFSFRCEGRSFDESHYARIMSEHYGTRHHQVEFTPERISVIEDLVRIADEPFSDIGIEVASYLLGEAVGRTVPYVLTGDGGDELFGGHPVYVADRAARVFDLLPTALRRSIATGLQYLPDSDAKKSLSVKLKRFSYSSGFPKTLYSNRWRVYYRSNELRALCTDELWSQINGEDGLLEVEGLYSEADGSDYLSKALYGDYHTVVDFYLRRMQMVRRFGVEGRFPMLDIPLVEFAARIPSSMKIRRFSDTKYILRKTMEGVLPDEIVFRKDKLGHSVPMKNWLRDSPEVQMFVFDYLNGSAFRERGLFDAEYVQQMIREHRRKKQNHSHRLWSLLVLELWMSSNVDRIGVGE